MPADAVITALEQQVDLYRRLAKLAEIQHTFVQNSQTEELLDVLLKRQEVLDVIAVLEQTIVPAKKRWNDYLKGLSAGDRSKAEEHLAESRELLEQITSADKDDALVLQQRKLNLGRQIDKATVAKQVNRTYASAAYGPAKSNMDVQR